MRRYSRLAIVVSHEGADGESGFGSEQVQLTNGSTTVEVSDFETALELLPPGSEVCVEAVGTVGNATVHNLSRIIRESNVLVALDLSAVTELSRVADSPFQNNLHLAAILFPCNLLSINPRAFAGCTSLGAVSIPASVRNIGGEAFSGCSSLKRLEFKSPDGWLCDGGTVGGLENPAENPAKFVYAHSPYHSRVISK